MALTEDQKNDILVEEIQNKEKENYRQEVRNKLEKGKWYEPKGCGAKGCMSVIILSLFFIILSAVINSVVTTTSNNPSNSQSSVSPSIRLDDRASYTSQIVNGRTVYTILFDTPLVEDDTQSTIFSAEVEIAIAKIYGQSATSGLLNFGTKTVNGVNYLTVSASDGGEFLILVTKGKQSGNILGFGLWKE